MSQQPFYPQQPGYPPQQPQQYAPPVQQPYPPQAYPAQQYAPPQYAAPQQAPAGPPPAAGSLDDFYNQPSASSGPSLSFKDKQIGFQYVGVVARDVTNADVQQMTDFTTKAPLFYRDGRPKFAMKVPLRVQPSPEFPEGEASWYVKGQARDELVRAMAEAKASEPAPKAGATIVITLAGRRPSGAGMNPANVFQVQYHPTDAGQQGTGAPSPAPVPQQAPVQQYAPPVQMPAYDGGQPIGQPQQVQPQYAPQQAQPGIPQGAQPVQQPAPQGQLQMPADFNAEQQALMARITGQPAA